MEKRSSEQQVRTLMASDTGHDPALWQELAGMGLLGLVIPEDLGGSGAGPVELGIVAEEMGRALLCGPYLSSAVMVPYLLDELGAGDERAAVLPRIAAGELIATVAYAEGTSSALIPDVPATTARGTGDEWRLTGEKTFVLDAPTAAVFYVLAATDAGSAVFAVERDAAGVTIDPLTTVDLTRKMGRVRFADTPARPVGAAGSGAGALGAALDRSAVALLGDQAGGAHRAMRMAVDYARTRFQFGRAIGSFQAVKHMCADMLLEAESAVSAARHVAAAFADEAPNRFADLALAQAYCSDAYVYVAATNIQVHGGIGFTWEHPAHLYLRRARTDAQLFGDPAWHRERYLQRIGA
ncbi:acyl-CoA dehydrogenase [Mycolicibacterium thermoresistibile ATCC 19527]|jgi:acyl-CoA dehydrogenase|uniref:Acyl-CoA dehydrogenase n=3 Tax=Mycolicibacterium thermoresistibile TaxID=1797 RepID=G7CDF2_MYCT3|nr:acyl-CoA dehydrogenase [Mycolicibacterium thermoresistibile ATCC 19527]GAT17195.1 acyl-CoA dehydrogenase [Mycolicibacterium thermoresistibile]SNW16427.1 acyl-CoA dehydrogenase [Mycolicibacterium thermoresistibile]